MEKAGFVNIIGRPNVGKSTLMNALVGEPVSIITHKPQTTRHRITGIVNGEDYQVVFSDSPGFIENPAYKMQHAMNAFVTSTFDDADLLLFLTDVTETYPDDHPLFEAMTKLEIPVLLVLNKTDLVESSEVIRLLKEWSERFPFRELVPISASLRANVNTLFDLILRYLPEGPPFYPKDQLTDRSERFFVSEIIREKILLFYQQEIPYSCEVVVDSFRETETTRGEALVKIAATIFINRQSQKHILIGKEGNAIKKLGSVARKSIESFLGKKVFLELHVKTREGWRDDDRHLKYFGYKN